ncbi:hypothetical protein PIB30_113258, partial [Stylosanthes scabra]|nr:hypothetical protein [Stylosanthes scabra]
GIQTTSAQAIKEEHKPPPKSRKTPPMIKPSKKPKEIHESKPKDGNTRRFTQKASHMNKEF